MKGENLLMVTVFTAVTLVAALLILAVIEGTITTIISERITALG